MPPARRVRRIELRLDGRAVPRPEEVIEICNWLAPAQIMGPGLRGRAARR
jgi:hypothetical protein